MLEPANGIQPPTPDWVGPKTVLVAEVTDLVSGRRFRVWYDSVEAARPTSRFRRRNQRLPFVVEHADSGRVLAALSSWSDVTAWHDGAVISSGWRVVNRIPEIEEPGTVADGHAGPPTTLRPEPPYSSGT